LESAKVVKGTRRASAKVDALSATISAPTSARVSRVRDNVSGDFAMVSGLRAAASGDSGTVSALPDAASSDSGTINGLRDAASGDSGEVSVRDAEVGFSAAKDLSATSFAALGARLVGDNCDPSGRAQKFTSCESALSGRLKIAQRFIAGIDRDPRRSP
jgi:hypothetical protein